ncbi:hypothetical protein F5X68DRAFT_250152 [Plectosphaerella plurivora]|uniref:SET domain-containing protein n=1 Tax=Plectosphaerella plurivora TaxID=936078 RepID=A0A9P8V210_9PEZI|nr:hypothetical protein F5X68DRAFT_250152 [Plectosphaerella plurivora]
MDSRTLDPENPDDRLDHLVSLMFDGFALTSGYGGVVQCPYDSDKERITELDCEEDDDGSSVASKSSPRQRECSTEETTDGGDSDGAPETKMIRTSIGLVHVVMDLAKKPLAESNGRDILFSNTSIEVRKSDLGGFGIFAIRDLVFQEHILIERTLFHASGTSVITAFESLEDSDRELFLDLHSHNPDDDTLEQRIRATFFTNNFVCGNRAGGGVFLAAARFNHACSARCSVKYAYDLTEDVMTFTIGRRGGVEAGEELTVCYGKDRDMLLEQYGFDCTCGACDSVLREKNEEQAAEWSV